MRGVCVIFIVVFLLCYVIGDESYENYRTSRSNLGRTKRQQQDDLAEQFFDRVFGIPINTLNSVNDLVKSTIPMFRRARDRIQQQYQTWQQNGGSNGSGGGARPQSINSGRPRPAHRSED